MEKRFLLEFATVVSFKLSSFRIVYLSKIEQCSRLSARFSVKSFFPLRPSLCRSLISSFSGFTLSKGSAPDLPVNCRLKRKFPLRTVCRTRKLRRAGTTSTRTCFLYSPILFFLPLNVQCSPKCCSLFRPNFLTTLVYPLLPLPLYFTRCSIKTYFHSPIWKTLLPTEGDDYISLLATLENKPYQNNLNVR